MGDWESADGNAPAVPRPGEWWLAIDFGTSNTAAAVVGSDGEVRDVVLEDGRPTMPSAVVWTGTSFRVGQSALNARRVHPAGFVAAPKRMLGEAEAVSLGQRQFSPVDLVAQVLSRVRERTATMFSKEPSRVVLTHPAVWGPRRTQALRSAAVLSGFHESAVVLLSEPVAAVWALSRGRTGDGRIVVVDYGGGTCDVAVLARDGSGGYEVLSQDGDADLGGNRMDDLLVEWVHGQLRAGGRDDLLTALGDSEEGTALADRLNLRDSVRQAKESLRPEPDADVHVSSGAAGHTVTITREEFERVVAGEIESAERLVRSAVTDTGAVAGLTAVFLTGGASYTRAVENVVARAAGRPVDNHPENRKTIVARGALRAPIPAAAPVPTALPAPSPSPVGTPASFLESPPPPLPPPPPQTNVAAPAIFLASSNGPQVSVPDQVSVAPLSLASEPAHGTRGGDAPQNPLRPSGPQSAPGWFDDPGGRADLLRWWNGAGWDQWQPRSPAQPGWYDDPHGKPGVQRWWNGSAWGAARGGRRNRVVALAVGLPLLLAVIVALAIRDWLPGTTEGDQTPGTTTTGTVTCWDNTEAEPGSCPPITDLPGLLTVFNYGEKLQCASRDAPGFVCAHEDHGTSDFILSEYETGADARRAIEDYLRDTGFVRSVSAYYWTVNDETAGPLHQGSLTGTDTQTGADVFVYYSAYISDETGFLLEIITYPDRGGTAEHNDSAGNFESILPSELREGAG